METIAYAGESGNTWVFLVDLDCPNKCRIDRSEHSAKETNNHLPEIWAARKEVIAYARHVI